MKHIRLISRLRNVLVLGMVDALYFTLANPTKGGSAVIIIACILLAVSLYVCARLAVTGVAWLLRVQPRRGRFIALALSGLGMFLLLMQSLGQLTLRDVLVIIPLIGVLYFYMSYAAKGKNPAPASRIRAERG